MNRYILATAIVIVAHMAAIAIAITHPVAFKATVLAIFIAMIVSAAFADR